MKASRKTPARSVTRKVGSRTAPTLARLSFDAPVERTAEFATDYETKLAPILKTHGLVESSEKGRATPAHIFSRLFEVKTPSEIAEKREALQRDPAWQEALRGLGTAFGSDGLIQHHFELYAAPAGPGKMVSTGQGQGYWRTYDATDGLAGGDILAILEDREGHLWFGLPYGVSRYDGKTWTTFTTRDGLAGDFVRSIFQDQEGHFWFGTKGGVSRYDGNTWATFTTQVGLASNEVFSILQDREGVLWFGTGEFDKGTRGGDGGVSRYDGNTWTTFTTKDGLADNQVRSIFQDREGVLWFGTGDFTRGIRGGGGGVSRYDGKTWTTITIQDGLVDNNVRSVFQDQEGVLWFGTGNGVSRYDGNTWTTFTTKDGLADNQVQSIFQDREGVLWLSTMGGVSRYDGKTRSTRSTSSGQAGSGQAWTTFTTEDGLASNQVSSMLQDREGQFWFGTVGGASRYDGKTFTIFTAKDGLANNTVQSILQDRNGYLWFSTLGGGVSRYGGNTWTAFTTENGLLNDQVWAIFQDREGNLWFSDWSGGVSRYDGETFVAFTTQDGLPGNTVRAILQDREGNLWFGTVSGGVSRYDGKTWMTFTTKDGLASNHVLSIIQDREGNLWFGTRGSGVSRYDGKTWMTFTTKDGLASNEVFSILQDQEGNLWFGTLGGGVSRYGGKNHSAGSGPAFTTFTAEDGLANNTVWSMLQDRDGHLWFGTVGGVSRYNGQVFQTMTRQDGLTGNWVRAIFQDRDRYIWFATTNGVTRYCTPASSPPPVFIDAVVADRRYEGVTELEISSVARLTAFEFHGRSFKTRPEQMVYRYRLKGHEEAWRNTRERRVEYEDLPVGEYTFEVVAVDRDLVYSKQPATVRLTVARDARDEQIDELERRVRERTRELQESNNALSDANRTLFGLNRELETRAREAQVEAALERVRAVALGMKRSEDLSQAGVTVFQELKGLGLPIWRGGFGTVDEASDPPIFETWGSTTEGKIIRGIRLPISGHPVLPEFYTAWKRQDDTHVSELTGELKKDYLQSLGKTGYPVEWPEQWDTYRVYHAFFTYGGLYVVTPDRLSEEDLSVLRRFRDGFAFAYTRFLDLQDAEKRAREAVRQAAVDRVRAEIAAMRTSADLERVTPLIWKELTALGVPFFRCGVYIVDEEAGQTHIYLTNPQGESLAALSLPFDSHPVVRGGVDHWRRGEVYVGRWDRETFVAWMAFLQAQGQLIERERYQDAEVPPESLVYQLVPFTQGMLYVGSAEALPEEDIDLVKSLANAFSVAYARYLDFQKLEAQNRALEQALDEKGRAQRLLIQAERMAAVGELVAGSAHELNNPLGAASSLVQSIGEMIQEDTPEELMEDRALMTENVRIALKDLNRAKEIVANLLSLSDRTRDYTEAVRINIVADDALRLLRGTYDREKVRVVKEYGENPPTVTGNFADLGQMGMHLVRNAVEAMKGEGTITLRTAFEGGQVVFECRDTGRGIPVEVLGEIFKPFFKTKPPAEGTGLGLYICHQIVEKHGGAIEVDSAVGKGTTFRVKLPPTR
jgi:ligand-binding sensor domain-containing protein/signal transduction histidine kinase